ncbi:MAG: hypothetical protein QOG71_1220 [Pyrinomonadaceae bacterium]|nr:hypothetical protein [Pyrinomonadaceae bacterium]
MKISGKTLRLFICLIVFAFIQQTQAAICQQDVKPFTRNNLISSIKLGRREKKPTARYIELINSYGVAFSLTPQDEIKIRQAGRYLGKKGLDDLIATIKNNYRPDVAQQPTATPTPEPQPNLIPVHYGQHPVIYDPATRTFKEGLADLGVLTIVVEFRNAHERGKELAEAKDIRAHINYEPFKFYENLGKGVKNPMEGVTGFAGVADGVWLDESQPVVNFARGETKTLILATPFPDGTFGVYDHPIEQRAGVRIPFPRLRMLTADKYVVKVQLTGGAKGEIAEQYNFTITLRPKFNITFG